MRKIEELLYIIGDMQRLSSPKDRLTKLVEETFEEALTLDELELVSAAANFPVKSFNEFEKILKEKG